MRLEEQFALLMKLALKLKATDLDFRLEQNRLLLKIRTPSGLKTMKQDLFDRRLIDYLCLKAGLDLCDPSLPQSGAFEQTVEGRRLDCRFSCLASRTTLMASLRLQNVIRRFEIDDLGTQRAALEFLKRLCFQSEGLIISCGPTGAGKTTTIHAMLSFMIRDRTLKIITLEDPVEIRDDRYIQLEINETKGLGYDEAISAVLRHSPDVLVIGECRSAHTAKMAIRAALTGTLVLMTLHAGNGPECMARLLELGVLKRDLDAVLCGVMAQRLITKNQRKECIYECWNREGLLRLLKGEKIKPFIPFEGTDADKTPGRLG